MNYEKLFSHLKAMEPPIGFFNKVLLAIRREQEQKQTRKILFAFLFLLIVSLIITPLSLTVFIHQIEDSGIVYFISAAVDDLAVFIALWQDFSLAILESLPIMGLLIFTFSLGVSLFTLRLFFCKKKILINYLFNRQLTNNII